MTDDDAGHASRIAEQLAMGMGGDEDVEPDADDEEGPDDDTEGPDE